MAFVKQENEENDNSTVENDATRRLEEENRELKKVIELKCKEIMDIKNSYEQKMIRLIINQKTAQDRNNEKIVEQLRREINKTATMSGKVQAEIENSQQQANSEEMLRWKIRNEEKDALIEKLLHQLAHSSQK